MRRLRLRRGFARPFAFAIFLTIPSCATAPRKAVFEYGMASWYGRRHQNLITANGERFDMNRLTAAHRDLPFGSRVRVRNPENGKAVWVRINDRGPYHEGRIIDLSREAARRIGMLEKGEAEVELFVAPLKP